MSVFAIKSAKKTNKKNPSIKVLFILAPFRELKFASTKTIGQHGYSPERSPVEFHLRGEVEGECCPYRRTGTPRFLKYCFTDFTVYSL